MTQPDYLERVYAGVLGKMIGVYLGRPFEGWTYERIMAELGEVDGYVNDRMPGRPPLVVTDDDLAGTFVFLRSLPDHGNDPRLTPAQIGETWLNYLIENRTILWWGGMGNSTEHTAYLRLKQGYSAPESGSMALNGKIIAEQIGAQIFIDGWAMACPGDPERAVDFARRAASVSHDGEAIYGAQVLAAMESQAFVESDIDALLDAGTALIPQDSVIYRVIQDVRGWHAGEPDWHKTRSKIAAVYGYDRYSGVCHMVPNHALIILGLLYGEGDFRRSMRVVNTAGWDTDCNAGNLGCLLGIRSGLAGFAGGPDWRGPVNDRLYLVSAEGGEAITDALQTAGQVVNIGRALAGEHPLQPKDSARFHFEAPGSTQGFRALSQRRGSAQVENVKGHSRAGERSLALHYQRGRGAAATPTFILPEELEMPGGYELAACPTLYAGQTLHAGMTSPRQVEAYLFIRVYNARDQLDTVYGPRTRLAPDTYTRLDWRVPDTLGQPVAEVGLAVEAIRGGSGVVYLDFLTWDGEPDLLLTTPPGAGGLQTQPQIWRRAWVNGIDRWDTYFGDPYRLIQNEGRGLLIQGARTWQNYEVKAAIKPTLLAAGGVGVRVQGMRRYYALLLCSGGKARLVKMLDGEQVLAEQEYAWEVDCPYELRLAARNARLRAWVDGALLFDIEDHDEALSCGAAALVCEEGHFTCDAVKITPVQDI